MDFVTVQPHAARRHLGEIVLLPSGGRHDLLVVTRSIRRVGEIPTLWAGTGDITQFVEKNMLLL